MFYAVSSPTKQVSKHDGQRGSDPSSAVSWAAGENQGLILNFFLKK